MSTSARSPGVAVREFVTERGPVDYLLVAHGKVAGSVEAKAEGHTLLRLPTGNLYAQGGRRTSSSSSVAR